MMIIMIMMMMMILDLSLDFLHGERRGRNGSVLTPLYHESSLCFWTFILEDKKAKKQGSKQTKTQKHTKVLSGIVLFSATEKTLGCLAPSSPFARSQVVDDNDTLMVIKCLDVAIIYLC